MISSVFFTRIVEKKNPVFCIITNDDSSVIVKIDFFFYLSGAILQFCVFLQNAEKRFYKKFAAYYVVHI